MLVCLFQRVIGSWFKAYNIALLQRPIAEGQKDVQVDFQSLDVINMWLEINVLEQKKH